MKIISYSPSTPKQDCTQWLLKCSLGLISLCCGLLMISSAHAQMETVTFNTDATGLQAAPFSSDDSSNVTFSDPSGAAPNQLNILPSVNAAFTDQAMSADGGSNTTIELNFLVPVSSLSLDFQGDVPIAAPDESNFFDEARLIGYNGAAQVASASVVPDYVNNYLSASAQNISIANEAGITRAVFSFYKAGAVANIGTEVIDNVVFDVAAQEPPTCPDDFSELYLESFDGLGSDNGTSYTTSTPEFSDSASDYFIATDGSNIASSVELFGGDGSFFGAQDIDGEGASSMQSLSTVSIDISGREQLVLSLDIAEDDDGTNEDWDSAASNNDFLQVQYRFDGGALVNGIWVEGFSSTANSGPPSIDTDFDGFGDGAEITDAFQRFSVEINVPPNSTNFEVVALFRLNSSQEDIALDNLQVCGSAKQEDQSLCVPIQTNNGNVSVVCL